MPDNPFGNQSDPPSFGAISRACSQRKCGMAPIQKTTRTASARIVIATVNRKVSSTPEMLIPTNSA